MYVKGLGKRKHRQKGRNRGKLFVKSFYGILICVGKRGVSQDNLESWFFLSTTSLRGETHVTRLGGKHLGLLSHLTGPIVYFLSKSV